MTDEQFKKALEQKSHEFAKQESVLDGEPFPYGYGFQEGAIWARDKSRGVPVEMVREARDAFLAWASSQKDTGMGLIGSLLAPGTLAKLDAAIADAEKEKND